MVSIRKFAASTNLGLGLAGVALAVTVIGCGASTTNNDQGASFSALGFFSAPPPPEPPPGLTGFNTELATDSASTGFAKQSLAYIGLENRLRNSFLRVTKVDCEYNVPGGTIPVPPDSIALSGFINASTSIGGPQIGGTGGSGGVGGASGSSTGATGGTGSTGSSSSGVSGGAASGTGNRLYLQFPVISSSIYAYINANRNSFPELPFQMQALCTATGITNAGDTVETNPVGLTAVFVESSSIAATGATGATGTGGNVNGFNGGDTSNTGDGTTTVTPAAVVTSTDTTGQ